MLLIEIPACVIRLLNSASRLITSALATSALICGSAIAAGVQSPTVQVNFGVIAMEGDSAPSDLAGNYSTIVSSSVSDSGDVAFSADLSGSAFTSAILLDSGGLARTLLRSGDSAPSGGSFKRFDELDLANGDFLLFRAELQGSAASEGLFLLTPQGVQTVQVAGDKTNGSHPGLTYKSFASPNIVTFHNGPTSVFSVNLAFTASVNERNMKALVWQDAGSAAPFTTLVTGDPIFLTRQGDVLDDFSLFRLARLGVSLILQVHKRMEQGFSEFRRFWRSARV